MFGRRLLTASRGGGGTIVSPPPPGGAQAITAAPNGGWIWFGRHSALSYGGYTFVGYIDGSNGNLELAVIDESDLSVVRTIVIQAALEVDDHNQPSLLVRASDHKLMMWFSKHVGAAMDQTTSVTSLDTDPTLADGFGSLINLDSQLGGSRYSYATAFEYSGTLYLFYRASSAATGSWAYATSANGGTTWTSQTIFYTQHTGYLVMCDDGAGKFHFAVSSDSPNVGTTALGHFYWDRTNWKASDGTNLGALPHDFSDATLVYNTNNAWVYDIALDGSDPVITFPSYEGDTHHARYAVWSGSWTQHLIADTGDGIKTNDDGTAITGGVYPGGMTLDPSNPSKVYLSKQTGVGVWELYVYTTANAGVSWSNSAITSGSTVKNVRPTVPKNYSADLRVLWMVGTYSDYTNWNTGISGSAD